MRVHREGIIVLLVVFMLFTSINLVVYWLVRHQLIQVILIIASIAFFLLILWFFRHPARHIIPDENIIVSPADGKIVVIEEVMEEEYFKDRRLQISVFMSPLNVHLNRYPVSGEVTYCQYHPGKYLVAWHPKSSLLNERSTVVIKDKSNREVLVRQIAGAVARRIVPYSETGDSVIQGDELGFIKFGSRVDLFLPVGTEINVKVGDKVKGNITTIAHW